MTEGSLSKGDIVHENYRIERFISAGSTGEVYLATNIYAHRQVALKKLRSAFSSSEAHVNLMRREALQDTNHKAVVRYFDFQFTTSPSEFHFIVMEYIDGPSLAALMDGDPLPEDELIQIGRSISAGLEAAHQKGILHRDVSPGNILLRDRDPTQATLIDFGVAKDRRPEAGTILNGGFAGTYEYSAPEQVNGDVDERSDIYALGATLLAAARGRAPEPPATPQALIQAKAERLDTAGVGERLRHVIEAMTAPDPNDRPQTAADARRLFEETMRAGSIENIILKTGPTDGRKSGRVGGPTPRRSVKRYLALATVLLCVGLGYLFREEIFGPNLPHQEIYRLTIESESATISGSAPSEEARAALVDAARAAFEDDEVTANVTPATGAPFEGWTSSLVEIISTAAVMEKWTLTARRARLKITGVTAPDIDADQLANRLGALATKAGFRPDVSLRPRVNPPDLDALKRVVSDYEDCGPLKLLTAGIGSELSIAVRGAVSTAEARDRLAASVAEIVQKPKVDLDGVTTRNPHVCRIDAVLPQSETSDLKIVYRDNSSKALVEDSFSFGEYITVEAQAPADMDGYIYAFAVAANGSAVHFLPHVQRPANRLQELGRVEDGVRHVRITYPKAERSPEKLGMRFGPPAGENAFHVFVTRTPMFPELHPRVENIEELVPEMASRLRVLGNRDGLIGRVERPLFTGP